MTKSCGVSDATRSAQAFASIRASAKRANFLEIFPCIAYGYVRGRFQLYLILFLMQFCWVTKSRRTRDFSRKQLLKRAKQSAKISKSEFIFCGFIQWRLVWLVALDDTINCARFLYLISFFGSDVDLARRKNVT